jgi:hypothetical protein
MPSIASASLPLRRLICESCPDGGQVLVADCSCAHFSRIVQRFYRPCYSAAPFRDGVTSEARIT